MIWIYTVDLNQDSVYFSWDCPICESNIANFNIRFLGTYRTEDYSLAVF